MSIKNAKAGEFAQRLLLYLETRVWPTPPKGASGRWTKAQEERAVGCDKLALGCDNPA